MSVRSASAGATAAAAPARLFAAPLAWAFGPGDPRQLAALRIGLCAVLLFRLVSRGDVYLALAEQPPELFRPLSFMTLLDQMPSRSVIGACLVVGIVAAALAAAGLLARVMLPIALAAATLLNGMYTAQGKVMHNDVLLTLCLLAIVFARHGDVWSLDSWLARVRSRRRGVSRPAAAIGPAYGWPVRAAMIAVALAYLIAGLHKIFESGGVGWASSENMRWILGGFKWSLQRLIKRSCDGQEETGSGSGGGAAGDALSRPSAGGKTGAPTAVLGGDRTRAFQRGRCRSGGCVGARRCPVVSGGWRDAVCHSRRAVGAVSVVR